MKRISYKRIYPLLILLALIGVGMFQRMAYQFREEFRLAELKASPYWEPSTGHGVYCYSEVDLADPRIPFTVGFSHPPGDRELVNETVRHLLRTGAKPQPWPEEQIQRFRIVRTVCMDRWEEIPQKLILKRQQAISALLEGIEHPTESDYRDAVLRSEYTKMGTVDAALEWFPKVED